MSQEEGEVNASTFVQPPIITTTGNGKKESKSKKKQIALQSIDDQEQYYILSPRLSIDDYDVQNLDLSSCINGVMDVSALKDVKK